VGEVHLVTGTVMISLNLVAGVWGAVSWFSKRPSAGFWYVLRAAQAAVVVQVLLGALLLVAGEEADEPIHYMYGSLPLLVNLFAEGMRAGAAQRELPEDVVFESLPSGEQREIALRMVRRETGVMAAACLLIVALGVRAAQVSGGF
jgi:hypothetical protein